VFLPLTLAAAALELAETMTTALVAYEPCTALRSDMKINHLI
jgi:hypothetical protein